MTLIVDVFYIFIRKKQRMTAYYICVLQECLLNIKLKEPTEATTACLFVQVDFGIHCYAQ